MVFEEYLELAVDTGRFDERLQIEGLTSRAFDMLTRFELITGEVWSYVFK